MRRQASAVLAFSVVIASWSGALSAQQTPAAARQTPAAARQTPAAAPQTPAASPFEVHEWGTFTSMQGADGTGLEGLHHEEEALPDFVHSASSVLHPPAGKPMKAFARRVTQKMETPVIYFHTETPRRVDVYVRFMKGLMTQYYPIPDGIWPPVSMLAKLRGPDGKGPLDMSKVGESRLHWRVDLVPYGARPPAEIPEVSDDDPWAFARQVRAAYVRNVKPVKFDRKTEAEHYLFYRGLGTFTMPVRVTAQPGARGMLHNDAKAALPFAVAVEMGERGGRFRVLGAVPAGGRVATGLERVAMDPDRRWVARALGARVLAALVEQGLFLDEARAMVATWSRQWFRSRGQRVIYIVPPADVARILPLTIRPVPDKTVRVLVGRLEYLTPEAEAATESALRCRLSTDPGERAAAEEWLAGLDRFLEPHVRRAMAHSGDDAVRRSAEQVLGQLVP